MPPAKAGLRMRGFSAFFAGGKAWKMSGKVAHPYACGFPHVQEQGGPASGKARKFQHPAHKPLAYPFGPDFFDTCFLLHGKPLHQPGELLRRDLAGFGRRPRPFKPA